MILFLCYAYILNLIKCKFHVCIRMGFSFGYAVSLATSGVCVFRALTLVGALFIFENVKKLLIFSFFCDIINLSHN